MAKQYELRTAYVIHGERVYYMDADNEKHAQDTFESQPIHDNLVKDNVFMMEEHVKEVSGVDVEIDVKALQRAERELEAEAWHKQMNSIISKSKDKLKRETGYGEKD